MTSNQEFNETIWDFYAHYARRVLPWRQPNNSGQFDPYAIVVSELMLQQTQVNRVLPKFESFLKQFPTVQALARASLAEVLILWSGLGYNRRAKFLWQSAQIVVKDYDGVIPNDHAKLLQLPGIGKNTAGAVLAYAFNQPVLFIETNVRSVYIHEFFNDLPQVPDTLIIEKLEQTLDSEHPREFYWALMDYGSYLKQTVGNTSRQSSTYKKQSKFEGSQRQVRGQVLKLLAEGPQSSSQLTSHIADERLDAVLRDLQQENLIQHNADVYRL